MDPIQARDVVKKKVMQEGKDVKDILEAYGDGILDLGDLEISFEGNDVKFGRRVLTNSVIVPVTSVPRYEVDGVEVNDTLDAKIVEVERMLLLAFKDVYAPGELDYSSTTACVGKKLFGFTKFEREKRRVVPIVLVPAMPSQPQPVQPPSKKTRIVPTLVDPDSEAIIRSRIPLDKIHVPLDRFRTEGQKKQKKILERSKVLGPLMRKEGMFDF